MAFLLFRVPGTRRSNSIHQPHPLCAPLFGGHTLNHPGLCLLDEDEHLICADGSSTGRDTVCPLVPPGEYLGAAALEPSPLRKPRTRSATLRTTTGPAVLGAR